MTPTSEEIRRIAIVSTDESALPDVEALLAPAFNTTFLRNPDDLLPLMTQVSLDALILDLDTVAASSSQALEILGELRTMNQDMVLVAVTRSRSRAVRLKASELGADEFFTAPVDFGELRIVLERSLDQRGIELENRRLREQIVRKYSFCELIGGSEPMQRVYDAISRVCDSNTTVILRGESGTGKELAAKAIVAMGPRHDKPFVSVNCAALPEQLIESELFGHEKGSFTGAHTARPGHIELAHTGTLFLDEIATLGPALQGKLLRVLEDGAVQRLGGRSSKKIDFRLITATNDDLEAMVHEGRFREDLYYRIHVIPVFLPPLRERPGDVPILVDHFLRLYCAANRLPLKRVEPEVMEILEGYPWPGNVRELENLIQRLVIMAEGPVVTPRHLPQQILYSATAKQGEMLIPEGGIDFGDEMARIETAYLQAALRRAGSKKAAGALLRLNPQQMKYLCRKYRIDRG